MRRVGYLFERAFMRILARSVGRRWRDKWRREGWPSRVVLEECPNRIGSPRAISSNLADQASIEGLGNALQIG